METLASVWACDPCDLSDLIEELEEPASVWDSPCALSSSPAAALTWMEQLSPQLQRNKQLQDILLQREEELARLQEENHKLRQFFDFSFVRNLERKAKKLTSDERRKLKRHMLNIEDGIIQSCSHQLRTPQQVSKRICRNLTAEFCSEPQDTPDSSEPNLDLWVLRTLGLKDRDTIDTSNVSSLSGYSLNSSAYDSALTSSSSSEYLLNSPFSMSGVSSAHSSVYSFYQSSTSQPDYKYKASVSQEANHVTSANASQSRAASPGQCSAFTATELNRSSDALKATIENFNSIPAFPTPPREVAVNTSPDRAKVCAQIKTSCPVPTLPENKTNHKAYWSLWRSSQTCSEEKVQFSPPRERVQFSPITSSSPVMSQIRKPVHSCSPTSTSAESQPSTTSQTSQGRTDLAFSMSLSPSSSVKTHSFPQGQAFVRKDTGGRWNFTWVPRQGP